MVRLSPTSWGWCEKLNSHTKIHLEQSLANGAQCVLAVMFIIIFFFQKSISLLVNGEYQVKMSQVSFNLEIPYPGAI